MDNRKVILAGRPQFYQKIDPNFPCGFRMGEAPFFPRFLTPTSLAKNRWGREHPVCPGDLIRAKSHRKATAYPGSASWDHRQEVSPYWRKMDMNLQHLKVVEHPAGATQVDLDVRDKRLNVLSEEVFADLDQVIRDLAKAPKERPIFLRSGKEKGFVVGADLRRLKELTEPEAVDRFLKKGQETMRAWAHLPNPTIAWVKGMALGGGLELALSCKYLLVSQGPNVQLGLPETKLGLLPGWGGTQLLPRRIGFEAALTMLLTGEPIDENRALALGLADGTWVPDSESTQLESWIETIHQKKGENLPTRPTQTELQAQRARFDESLPLWSQLLGGTVEEEILRARRAILSAVFTGVEKGIEAGLDEERKQFCPLVGDPKVQAHLDRFMPKK